VDEARPVRVLLGNLEPITVVGLRRVLADDGVEVIAEEHAPSRIVSEARRLQPDVVLLDRGSPEALGEEVRNAAPQSKVILWARDETVMEVLDAPPDGSRLVALTAQGVLRSELAGRRHRQLAEE
jgi:DNA-binding NarL/FixJ family response regulator